VDDALATIFAVDLTHEIYSNLLSLSKGGQRQRSALEKRHLLLRLVGICVLKERVK
jgi:hypothetical protein